PWKADLGAYHHGCVYDYLKSLFISKDSAVVRSGGLEPKY
ncbi:MAG: hypothetical protein ACI9LX_002541, partial [Paraglaciecola sp.]